MQETETITPTTTMTTTSKKTRILWLPGYGQNINNFKSSALGTFKFLESTCQVENIILQGIQPCWNTGGTNFGWYHSVGVPSNQTFQAQLKSLNYILNYLEEQPPFDILTGFSQGAAMTAFLSYLSQVPLTCKLLEIFPNLNRVQNKLPKRFILYSGYWPEAFTTFHNFLVEEPIQVASLHIIGSQDTIVLPKRSEELAQMFQESSRRIQHHLGTHFIPYSNGQLNERLQEFVNQK